MPNAKQLKPALIFDTHPIIITGKTSFGKTFNKIFKAQNMDFVVVKKPKQLQMAAVILNRVLGKKFLWAQHFENPPVANFIAKALLAQADKLFVANKKDANKLISFGISKRKIVLHYKK